MYDLVEDGLIAKINELEKELVKAKLERDVIEDNLCSANEKIDSFCSKIAKYEDMLKEIKKLKEGN
jgi:hypothetical protein